MSYLICPSTPSVLYAHPSAHLSNNRKDDRTLYSSSHDMSAPFTDSVIERLIYLFFFRLEIHASLEYKLFLSRQLLFHLAHTTYLQDSKLFLCFLMQLNKATAIHCKKRLPIFPSPAGMSLTKLYLGGKNLIIPRQGEFGQ
jgi:hypothetical protein